MTVADANRPSSLWESRVAYYSSRWPCVFERARGSQLFDTDGRPYLDFFCAAGSLNYGHNDPHLVDSIVSYLSDGGVLSSLDAQTVVRRDFISGFAGLILGPRSLEFRLQFTSPSGSDCVEAALRLARKFTGRSRVASLTGAFHGETLGALSVSDRVVDGAPPSGDVVRIPHDRDVGSAEEAVQALERAVTRDVAALIIEVVQGEGGCRPLSPLFLANVRRVCDSAGALLIVDDVQAGCGRTGPFLSVEDFPVAPDLVCLSKSLSGSGLPMSLLLLRPELDIWRPGEFSGTFRGNDLAFVTGAVALRTWWADLAFELDVRRKGSLLRAELEALAASIESEVTGLGLMLGLTLPTGFAAQAVASAAFDLGLLIETCGSSNNIVKLMPPLTVTDHEIAEAIDLLREALSQVSDGSLRPPEVQR